MASPCCPSCCLGCTGGQLRKDKTYRGPYSLNNFISAGTLIAQLDPERPEIECSHTHAEDGWHVFSGKIFDQHLLVHEGFCREMDFLITHRFISVTYRFGCSLSVFLRIYLIPYDLPNVQGKLRIRNEAIIAPTRGFLNNLLPTISRNEDYWNGLESPSFLPTLLPGMKDPRTLAEIYGDLASPQSKITLGWENFTSRLLEFNDDLSGLGLRSTLYNYQRRSVNAMLQRELDLSPIPDPLFIELSCMNNHPFYLQPGTMEILKDRPIVDTARSGILCEELGTGKTVMILALILATLNQISSPEESIVDDRPVLTALSFRHFPSPESIKARKRFYHGRGTIYPVHGSKIPTLVELLLNRIRTNPDTTVPNLTNPREIEKHRKKMTIANHLEQIRLGELLRANGPFYFHYDTEQFTKERVQRRKIDPGPRVVYLTSATLVIVPPNLLSQWYREIQKHCEYPLRVLILRPKTRMPRVSSLASDFDIVLMTYTRYATEARRGGKDKLHSWDICRCPEFPEARIPDCKCKGPDVSPLLQIRWKRLVVDEGHVSASLSSVLSPFTKLLSVERRWIVTGTPTTNLLGLSLGKKSNENHAQVDDASDPSDTEEDASQGDDRSLSLRSSSSSRAGEPPLRVWNNYDREDLRKFKEMITHFIAVPQFNAIPKLVTTHITTPLLDRQGPRPGSIQVLNQVMEMTMIRHRIEDVEEEVVLPPLKHESVLLDLDPYAAKSYNAMQASIAINAVDSQRTDQDYMFHPGNSDFLQTTVKNMSQIMFWSVDTDHLYYVDELLEKADGYAERAIGRNMLPEDRVLLDEAFKHIKLAAKDPLWKAMHTFVDVPYRVRGLQQAIFDAWTRIPQKENTHDKSQTGFIHADRLLKMQRLIIQRPRISEESLIDNGVTVAAHDLHLQMVQREKSNKKSGKQLEDPTSGLLATDAGKRATDMNTLKEIQKDLEAALAHRNDMEDDEDLDAAAPGTMTRTGYHGGSLLSTSLLGNVRLGCTASTKLNYIMNEVLQYADTEKFLIFSDSQLTLAHIFEALELMHVKSLRFTSLVEPRVREQLVLTFETSETYRVFLMELKHGARGLNLVSASRVIFCEPVWQADVESQAIKRAHRIGQLKPITVKTLAIRGTAEENMVARRNALKNSQTKLPKMVEEAGMRHFIANPKFIDYDPERYSTVDLPLLRIEPVESGDPKTTVAASETSPQKRIRPHDPIIITASPPEPPTKKKRNHIRFE